ncbi:hypothetical protein GTU99_12600 [Streptomyces sp. PRKS01-65]|nr:hypothetical protein [Streptomyces harenosi]NEY33020.1 hypothetical protein [Streptomyces harenosi]
MAPTTPAGSPDSGGPADRSPAFSAGERAEYELLRRQASVRHRRARVAGSSVLLVLTLLLAPLAMVAAWVQDTVSDTDRYVATVAPLASEPAVQDALTDRLTDRVVGQVDVKAVTDSFADTLREAGAPPRIVDGAESLEAPLRDAVRSAAERTVSGVVTSDAFRRAWEGANQRSHAAVVHMLTGEGRGALSTGEGAVRLDVGEVVDQVRARLADAGFDEAAAAIPDSDRTVTLLESEQLGKAQDVMRLLDIVGVWLPVLTAVLAALAVWTAPAHRVMLMATATGVGAMMALLLVALAVLRRAYLDSLPPAVLPPDAAAAVYDTFVRFLHDSTRTLLVVVVVTALAAYLHGAGRVARAARGTAARVTAATGRALYRSGVDTGSTGRLLAQYRPWATSTVVAGGELALLLWNHPTVTHVALVLGITSATLIVLAVLAAAAGPAHPSPDRTAS